MNPASGGNNAGSAGIGKGAGGSPDVGDPPKDERGGGRAMSVIDFFEYLAASEHTEQLAHELADVWVARQLGAVFVPAA
jgi:hypothetical protein